MSAPVVGPLREPVAPSFYQLPQQCSEDRLRARRATIADTQRRFALTVVPSEDGLPPLPAHVAKLPKEAEFPLARRLALGLGKARMRLNARVASFVGVGAGRYERLYQLIDGPRDMITRWRDDGEFARQRLAGVNPMSLRRCDERPPQKVAEAARDAVRAWGDGDLDLDDLRREGRLFCVDYEVLLDPGVQRYQKRDGRSRIYAPYALFGVDALHRLRPLAICVRAPDGRTPVASASGDPARWLVARGHVQCADAQVHEAYYHLFETHLVNETLAACLFRNVYPEHPVRQLLEQHYEYNIAIDCVARGNLLARGGPIDKAMPGGAVGAMAVARAMARGFDLRERTLHRDLELRGMRDIPDYPYRDDAVRVRDGMLRYVRGTLSPWYRSERDVLDDHELRAWLDEVAGEGGITSCPTLADAQGGGVDGPRGALPSRVETPSQLFEVLTEFIFRASAQHAAVNNGQYDAYGFVPNAPGTFAAELRETGPMEISDYFDGLPLRDPSVAQLGMVWVLSAPTLRSLLYTGDCGAFAPNVCWEAAEAVAAFRRRMHELSDAIEVRNKRRAVPYRYLDPRNISRSTDI